MSVVKAGRIWIFIPIAHLKGPLRFELICLSCVAGLGAAGAAFWGAPLAFTLIGILIYTGWHLFHLARLSYLIQTGYPLQDSFPPGLWEIVYKNAYTLKKRSRKRKRRLARFLKRFTESAAALPDAAVIIGQDNDIEWCNPAAAELLGLYWPHAAGQNLAQAVGDPVFEEYLYSENQAHTLEFPSPVDQTKILSLYITPFGKKRQHLLIARDITRSYYVDRMRRDFIANASHELRTPLTVIRGFLEVWDTQEISPPQQLQQPIELMLEQTRRMEQTINDMLTLSHLEYDDKPSAETNVEIPTLLNSIVKEATALSGEMEHKINVCFAEERHLYGNATELRDAFSNLIFNAVRHTPPRTQVEVSWTPHEDGAQLIVKDSGEGIPARHIPRLTERFYRIDPARSRDSGGTGLGLAIAKHVLTRHEGELHISSEVGKGSIFTCIFPNRRLVEPVMEDTDQPGVVEK